ncbi:hypothetical protein ACJJTC_004608 [Scirpophaga incertulas]
MESEIAKSKALSKEETKALLALIERNYQFPCTPQQLRLKWENLKKNSRKRYAKIRSNHLKVNWRGPPDYIPPDDILDRVAELLGSIVCGFAVPFGGDRESEVIVGGDVNIGDGCGNGGGSTTGDARVTIIDIHL